MFLDKSLQFLNNQFNLASGWGIKKIYFVDILKVYNFGRLKHSHVAEWVGRGPQNLQRRFPACRQAGIPSVTRIILEETIEVIIPGNGDVSF